MRSYVGQIRLVRWLDGEGDQTTFRPTDGYEIFLQSRCQTCHSQLALSLRQVINKKGKSILGYHLKTGHTLSVQNRPTGLAEDVIVLPCRSVDLQGVA
jgi:hypothetical protein